MGIIEILTIIFIVMKLAGVGAFADWDIIALPWHWSCLCLEMWTFIAYFAIIVIEAFCKERYKMKTEIVQKIAEHLEHAKSKHPLFCVRICGEGTTLENVKALLKRSRENRDNFKTADWVLSQEVQEVFEAYLEGRYRDCREEIYDTIAVLLRMDEKLVSIIKANDDECAEKETD